MDCVANEGSSINVCHVTKPTNAYMDMCTVTGDSQLDLKKSILLDLGFFISKLNPI